MFGLFTSWTAAIYARQDELDQRAVAYFDVVKWRRKRPFVSPTAAETSSRNPADVAPFSAAASTFKGRRTAPTG
jgi:hypothetical protein